MCSSLRHELHGLTRRPPVNASNVSRGQVAAAACRMVKSIDTLQQDMTTKVAQTEALQADLDATEKKVGELEKEVKAPQMGDR